MRIDEPEAVRNIEWTNNSKIVQFRKLKNF